MSRFIGLAPNIRILKPTEKNVANASAKLATPVEVMTWRRLDVSQGCAGEDHGDGGEE